MDATVERLLGWLRQEGVTFPKIEVRSVGPGERGVFAAANIAPKEVVFDVPGRVTITQYTAYESSLGRRIREAGLQLQNDDAIVAAHLLQEHHRPDSFWRPFLDTLPQAFPHFPIFYGPEELALLKGTSMVDHIEEHRETALDDDKVLRENVPEYARFSVEQYLWARAVLWSRRFGGQVKGQRISALVPVMDMLNHRRHYNFVWACRPDMVQFIGMPTEYVRAGMELFTTYGEKSNRDYLFGYGFALEDNGHDVSALILKVPDGVPQASTKRELLAGKDDPAALFRFNLSVPRTEGEKVAHAELFSFLRFVETTPEELAQLLAAGKKPSELGPISAPNEIRALQLFGEACRKALAEFETSIDDDEKLLRSGKLSYNARNCVILRRGEKRLLRHYIDQSRAMAGRIQKSPEAFNRQLQAASSQKTA